MPKSLPVERVSLAGQVTSALRENRVRAHDEHTRLIDLCEARMKREAVKLLHGHIVSARDDLLSYVKEHHT